jgi:hypothetical protein
MTQSKRRLRITILVDVPDYEAADALGVDLAHVRYLVEDTIIVAARDALRDSMPSTASSVRAGSRTPRD